MKQIATLLALILPIILNGMNYTVGDTLNVVAIDGLTVRATPSTKGEKIAVLKTQERVCIKSTADFKNERDSIFGFGGNWVLIESSGNVKGYVFDAFLSTLPVANSVSEIGKSMPNRFVVYSESLPGLLEKYVIDNFTKNDCVFEYQNRYDGESAHAMKVQGFQRGHVLIEHQYWEGGATELNLENVRISEIYYLIHQFLKDTNEEFIKLNDHNLRNPKLYSNWKGCVGELVGGGCVIELYKDSETSYSIKFNFLCC